MKTKITIEFETKNMKKIVPEEYFGDVDSCPKDEEMTEETEKELHRVFKSFIEDLSEKSSSIHEALDERITEDVPCENIDSLNDYGECTITVKSK